MRCNRPASNQAITIDASSLRCYYKWKDVYKNEHKIVTTNAAHVRHHDYNLLSLLAEFVADYEFMLLTRPDECQIDLVTDMVSLMLKIYCGEKCKETECKQHKAGSGN